MRDIKAWFNCYEAGRDSIFDHIVHIADDEIEGSVYSTSTTSSMMDSHDGRSRSSTLASESDEQMFYSGPNSPLRGGVRSRGNSNAPLPMGMASSFDKTSALAEGMAKINV